MIDAEIKQLSLRNRAETKINHQKIQVPQEIQKLSLSEIQQIFHELEVHQIELEMQNEEILTTQEELKKTKNRYFDLYDMAPLSYCTLNQEGLIQEVNLATSSLLGVSRDKLLNKPLCDFIFEEDQDIYYMYNKKFAFSNKLHSCELRMTKADKTPVWVYLSAIAEKNDEKEFMLRLVINDISERKLFEEQQKLSSSVFKNTSEAIVITNLEGIICDVNDAFSQITGYSKEEAIDNKTNLLKSGKHSDEYYKIMWETLKETGSWSGEIWNKKKNGQIYAEMLNINTVYDYNNKPSHFIALFSDITTIKEYESSLKNIAHFDQLTKLPNRVLLANQLEKGIIQANLKKEHLAVIFLDLDGFKEVNDAYGHMVGDRLLVALAKEMKFALREEDTLARIGGDEFVAVLYELTETSDYVPIITRLLQSAAKAIQIDEDWVQVSASLGVTFYPQNQTVDADLLLRQADQAMYQAKISGKNRHKFFNTEENSLIRKRFEDIQEIRQALKNKEFILNYQPKINMSTGKVIGVEALIRWKHPLKGIVPPLAFLPIIEEHALSVDIGEWVIHTALAQIKLWQEDGLNIPISVNIGAHHLLNEGFAHTLKNILAQYPTVKPSMLELEVLETSRLEDLKIARKVMYACIKLGITFSLDDFGTGYSSLIYLKQLPIKQIKIDQSFVLNMLNDPNDLSILEGIINLGKAFHYSVIAEGVETSEHATILLSLGCELGQGYEIARPMPAEQCSIWIKEYKPNDLWQNQKLVTAHQRQLLFTKVQHRAFIEKVKDVLNKKDTAYEYDLHECEFQKWQTKNIAKSLDIDYAALNLKHKNIHIFVEQLLTLHHEGNTEEALDRLSQLYRLSDELLNELSKIH